MVLSYDLDKPTKEYKLPKEFAELSGVCPLPGRGSLAFVQDEAIRVYEFDLSTEEITEHARVEAGDAEDIVVIGDVAYVLEAGEKPAIHKISGYASDLPSCERYDLDLDMDYDPEGLCHDASNNRLLIACKGSPKKKDTTRKVLGFDLETNQRGSSPVLTVDSEDFVAGKDVFHPSGIAIHPISGDVYLIGSRGAKMLVCYGTDGAFKGAWELDDKQFAQPEGIAFMDSGDLIISSEAGRSKKRKKGKAKIFVFAAR